MSTVVTVADSAVPIINAMVQQVAAVEQFWGRHDPVVANKCLLSLAYTLPKVLTHGFGPGTLVREGELCLRMDTDSGFVFALIDWRLHQADAAVDTDLPTTPAPKLGRYCYRDQSSSDVCLKPITNGKPTCGHNDPVIVAAPIPLEWSSHS